MFFDALSTGHMGMATVHSESAESVLDRLITLIKKDVKAQYYTEDFLKRMLANSIDVIIFLKDFKVENIITTKYIDGRMVFQKYLEEENNG